MKQLTILKILAILEGISYISFAITMPIKYMMHWPLPNQIVGMAHGILFIAYCLWVLIVAIQFKKPFIFYMIGWFMSLIPFGTFWFERKFLNKKAFADPELLD